MSEPSRDDLQSAFLKVAVVGAAHPERGGIGHHTTALADKLQQAGHEVTLVSWSHLQRPWDEDGEQLPFGGPADGEAADGEAADGEAADEEAADEERADEEPAPRTLNVLGRARPDTWLRTGWRLRGVDAIVLVHATLAAVPAHLAILRGAAIGQRGEEAGASRGPRSVLICHHVLPRDPDVGSRRLLGSMLRRVDSVLVHSTEQARIADSLGAGRVYAADLPSQLPGGRRVVDRTGAQVSQGVGAAVPLVGGTPAPGTSLRRLQDLDLVAGLTAGLDPPGLSAPWASYVGALEALAAPDTQAEQADDAGPVDGWIAAARPSVLTRLRAAGRAAARAAVPRDDTVVELSRTDLPDWLLASDVLADAAAADEARAEARRLGLPRSSDAAAAWAALGALAAVLRVGDDGRRTAVLVEESGPRSPLSGWARAVGFAPVGLRLTGPQASVATVDVDAGTLDVVARVHPGGCGADDVDETVSQASWALRPGGLLILTLPLGPAGAHGAVGPADVRGVVARAHDQGFLLVGDLDGELTARMMRASSAATAPDTAYGLVRLTLRRR